MFPVNRTATERKSGNGSLTKPGILLLGCRRRGRCGMCSGTGWPASLRAVSRAAPDVSDRNCAVNLLAIDEQSRRRVHAQSLGLFHRCPHRHPHSAPSRRIAASPCPRCAFALAAWPSCRWHRNVLAESSPIDFLLVRVQVVGEVPVGVVILRRQAVRINCGMDRPGMNLRLADSPCR